MDCIFRNPIIAQGQDPSAVFHDGYYYLVQSNAGQLTIAKSSTLTGLGKAAPVPVYAPPSGEPYSYDLWAPELVYLRGHWYIYVAATVSPGNNATHRMYVLQADSADPQGSWTMRGKVYDTSSDKWAIDGTVFEYNGQIYMVWSGWPGDIGDFPQNLYIARMSDPLTIEGERYVISEPDQPWERSVAAINEGPEAFIHDGQLSIVYSADASWTPAYKLGLVKLVGADPLDTAAWEKHGPIFSGYNDSTGIIYGVGHNSMPVTSPDGTEDWLIYHTKTVPADGWEDRVIALKKFVWNVDGTPDFGRPLPLTEALELPAGDSCGEIVTGEALLSHALTAEGPVGEFRLANAFVDTGAAWVNILSSYSVAVSVKLDATGMPMAILSQDGGISSNFALEYTGEKFAFTLFDPFGSHPVSAVGTTIPFEGTWYHLVAVRDARSGEARLFVNGALESSVAFKDDWNALGNTIVGGARKASQRVGLLSGLVSDLQIFNGALSTAEAAALFSPH